MRKLRLKIRVYHCRVWLQRSEYGGSKYVSTADDFCYSMSVVVSEADEPSRAAAQIFKTGGSARL